MDARALWSLLRERAVEVPERVEPVVLLGRALTYLLFFIWGLRFLSVSLGVQCLSASFMHAINLVFHEAGHVLFMPFGHFLMFLGGSLNQLLVPLLIGLAFLVKNRDPFGASLCLWWLGESLMELAPYIGDARALQMVLLGGYTGKEVEGHDWETILGTLGLLGWDHTLARLAWVAGKLLMIAALAWGGYVLHLQRRRLRAW